MNTLLALILAAIIILGWLELRSAVSLYMTKRKLRKFLRDSETFTALRNDRDALIMIKASECEIKRANKRFLDFMKSMK